MKTNLKALALGLALTSSLTISSQARAGLAVASFGTTTTVVYGLVFMGGSAVLGVLGTQERPLYQKILMLAAAVPLAGLGILTLDGEGQQLLEFKPLTEKEAVKMGLLESERLSYNSEVDQANFLLSEVHEELKGTPSATEGDSLRIWESLKDQVAPETLKAMQKITSQLK